MWRRLSRPAGQAAHRHRHNPHCRGPLLTKIAVVASVDVPLPTLPRTVGICDEEKKTKSRAEY